VDGLRFSLEWSPFPEFSSASNHRPACNQLGSYPILPDNVVLYLDSQTGFRPHNYFPLKVKRLRWYSVCFVSCYWKRSPRVSSLPTGSPLTGILATMTPPPDATPSEKALKIREASPTSVASVPSSTGDAAASSSWEIPRWKYFQEKRLQLCQQRVRLEQRLFEFDGAQEQTPAAILSPHYDEATATDRESFRPATITRSKVSKRRTKSTARSGNTEHQADNATKITSITVHWSGPFDAENYPTKSGHMVFPNGQVYQGQVAAGLRHGVGSNAWPNGQAYRGEWLQGSRTGRGTHTWPDGRRVTGQWLNGHLHGRVFYTWPDAATYDGDCLAGKKHGRGISTTATGSVYQGQYSEGKEQGFGTLTETDEEGKDATKYRGQFRLGQRQGYGIQIWREKSYDGEWNKNAMEGRGKLAWNNGAAYTGYFLQNKCHGAGSYMDPAGNKFVGEWDTGVRQGHGVQYWRDGGQYNGSFHHGRRHGYGRMSEIDGSLYCGGWKDGKRHGRGIQVSASNTILHCGLWTEDDPLFNEAPDSWHDDLDVTSLTTLSDGETSSSAGNTNEALNRSVDSPLVDLEPFDWENCYFT